MNLRATRIARALEVPLDELRTAPLAPVDIAIVDSGIDATHRDLAGRVAAAYMVSQDAHGPEVREVGAGANNDACSHGTGVAGIIAALAPNARLLDVRVLDEHNSSTGETMLAGIRHAIELGARIINLSLASKAKFRSRLVDLCEQAYRRNQLVVAAKRNMPLTDNGWPAEHSSVLGVDAGSFPSPFLLRFQALHAIEFVARGDRVLTTARGGGYTEMTGTSFATPTVAGLTALLLGAHPDLCSFEIKTILRAYAEAQQLGTPTR